MKTIINRLTALHASASPWIQSAVLLFLRVTIGYRFFLAGKGKLANFANTAGFFESLHIPAPAFHAGLVGYTEMIGGLLLIAGLGTRLVAVPLMISMVVAYLTAHREEAFSGLYEFTEQAPFTFLCATLVLFAFGSGKLSLDGLFSCWWKRRES